MNLKCDDCGETFDDAERSTICPHDLIMPREDLDRKIAALRLLERDICFAHQPAGPTHRVQAVRWNGMVTLAGMPGEFAPHLFVEAGAPNVIHYGLPPIEPPICLAPGDTTLSNTLSDVTCPRCLELMNRKREHG